MAVRWTWRSCLVEEMLGLVAAQRAMINHLVYVRLELVEEERRELTCAHRLDEIEFLMRHAVLARNEHRREALQVAARLADRELRLEGDLCHLPDRDRTATQRELVYTGW
jgi:hypothetical protein